MIGILLATAAAAPSFAALTYQSRTGLANNSQAMIVDSNKCPNQGPTSAFVGGTITNTGATTATNITASLTGLNANVYLTGGEVATRAIGSLNPGESIADLLVRRLLLHRRGDCQPDGDHDVVGRERKPPIWP